MKLVIFGRSVSSSGADGHSSFWRGIIRALHQRNHHVVFFENEVPAQNRDLPDLACCDLIRYSGWSSIQTRAAAQLADCDAAIVSSDCSDASHVATAVLSSAARVRCFYDLAPARTVQRLRAGKPVKYIPESGLGDFDLVLGLSGGQALAELKVSCHARHVAPLYPAVDSETFYPVAPVERFLAGLSFYGTYSADWDAAIEMLVLEPARRRPDLHFLIAGSGYPPGMFQPHNIRTLARVRTTELTALFCSSKLTLNLTPAVDVEYGYCPSVLLLGAAACGVPVLTDEWEGLDYFFEPGLDILVARTTGHVMDALARSPDDLARIGHAGRERVLSNHTCERRALELESLLETAASLPVESAGHAL